MDDFPYISKTDMLRQCILVLTFDGTPPVNAESSAVGPCDDDDLTGTPQILLVWGDVGLWP